MTRIPAVALFTGTALAIALTAGAGLGLWLLLARVFGLPVVGTSWLALVQVHGTMQLFGFAGFFLMGVGLHVVPRFRGSPPPPRRLVTAIYVATLAGLLLRIAQPFADSPLRDAALDLGSLALVVGTTLYAVAALRTLRSGDNPHRVDEFVIALGVCGLPAAALVGAVGLWGAPAVVDQAADDRTVWLALLGALCVTIFGVWARLAPAFVASPPVRHRAFFVGLAVWVAGIAALLAEIAAAPWALLLGLALIVWALGVFGPTIARQPLAGHARLTRLAIRSAFGWALVGTLVLAASSAGPLGATYLVTAAARHAFALGFVTLMIYGVAARALPAFLGRELRSPRLQLAAIALTNAGVALRVLPQAAGGSDAVTSSVIGLSGMLAYAGLLAFAANLLRTLRAPIPTARLPLGSSRIEVRL